MKRNVDLTSEFANRGKVDFPEDERQKVKTSLNVKLFKYNESLAYESIFMQIELISIERFGTIRIKTVAQGNSKMATILHKSTS